MPELYCPLAESALRTPESTAIKQSKKYVTFRELDLLASRIAEYLCERGIKAHDHVGLSGEMCARWVASFFALLRLGAVASPLSARLPDSALSQVAKTLSLGRIISIDNSSLLPHLNSVSETTLPPDSQLPVADASASHALNFESPATAILTSGSSSEPKAALHSFGNHLYSARGLNQFLSLGKNDKWLLSLPVHHVAGLAILFRTMVAGATLVIPKNDESILTSIATNHITHLSLVSTQLRKIMDSPAQLEKARGHLKAILLGGSSFPIGLLRRAVASRLPIFFSYGLTEMSSTVTARRLPEPLTLSCGEPLPFRKVRLSASGEIEVAGKTLFLGYLGESGNRLTDDGWFRTGDCGILGDNNELTITGRLDNLIISGGENIRPEEIETALRAIEGISEAIVVPIDDEKFGQRPVAFIRLSKSGEIDEKTYRRHLAETLEPFKIPDYFFNLPPDDNDVAIKPSRAELTALARRLLASSNS